jgi:hypothetical protein
LYHFSVSTDKRPSAQKYSGTYNIAEANRATHSQMYSPARRWLGNSGLIQHQYYTENVSSEKKVRKKGGQSHRCRYLIVIVSANADVNPDRNEDASEADRDKSKASWL